MLASKNNNELSSTQHTAIALLMAGNTRIEIAETLQIPIRTLDRWIASPGFRNTQKEAAITVFEQSLTVIAALTTKAVFELERILEDDDVPARVKLTAIGLILDNATKLKSYELEQRLEQIENTLNDSSYFGD